jgi:hypothetical protein
MNPSKHKMSVLSQIFKLIPGNLGSSQKSVLRYNNYRLPVQL